MVRMHTTTYPHYASTPARLIMSALLAVACGSEPHTDIVQQPEAVCFSTNVIQPVDDGATRLSTLYDATSGIPQNGSIGIYGYYHDNSSWAGHYDASAHTTDAKPNFMLNQQATNATPGSYYTYTPLKYWPNESGDRVSFVAYYPYTDNANSSATGIVPLLTENVAALPSYRFTVKNLPADQVDFLVSPLLTDLQRASDHVHFPLYHATAKVYISVIVNDDLRQQLAFYKINNLQLTNLKNAGVLTYTSATDYGWSERSGSQSYAFLQGEPQLLLPQTLSDGVCLTIDYSLTFNTAGTVYQYEGTGQAVAVDQYTYAITGATAQLNTVPVAAPITEWLPNHVYHYIIRLGARNISFTAQVVDWGEKVETEPVSVEED